MNEEIKKDRKKLNKYYIFVLVTILLIGIISATYAYFQIKADSSSANTNITGMTECFDITFEDKSDSNTINLDKNYPITDDYALGQTDSIYNLKPVVVKVTNHCTQKQDNLNYKLVITTLAKDTGYISNDKIRYDVKKALNSEDEKVSTNLLGPAYLDTLSIHNDESTMSILEKDMTSKGINLGDYTVKNTYIIDSDSLASNTFNTYYIRLWIDYYEGDKEAYTDPAKHTAGNEYDNSTQDKKFTSVISLIADGTTSKGPKSTIDTLREKEEEVSGGVKYLSTDPVGGMYRYQGINDVPNWICFGTKSKEECTNEDTGIDKYMYRIIGITEEGQLYLLKETFLKEGSTTRFAWDDVYEISGSGGDACPDGKCPEWNTSDLFERINGTANGSRSGAGDFDDNTDNNTDIFVDSSYFDYLKSEDNVDEEGNPQPSEWYSLIETHNWMYGDTTKSSYDGNEMYAIETGQAPTTHYVQNPEGSTTVESKEYNWTGNVSAKISLMYMHDVLFAYPGASGAGSSTNVKNSWIYFQKDGYNSSPTYEWLSTRWGFNGPSSTIVFARGVDNNGGLSSTAYTLITSSGVRPVFYLSSQAKIVDGDGTKDSPFILGLTEDSF